jgi:hypothetical protein
VPTKVPSHGIAGSLTWEVLCAGGWRRGRTQRAEQCPVSCPRKGLQSGLPAAWVNHCGPARTVACPLTSQPPPSNSPFPRINQFVSTEGRELQSKQIMPAPLSRRHLACRAQSIGRAFLPALLLAMTGLGGSCSPLSSQTHFFPSAHIPAGAT